MDASLVVTGQTIFILAQMACDSWCISDGRVNKSLKDFEDFATESRKSECLDNKTSIKSQTGADDPVANTNALTS